MPMLNRLLPIDDERRALALQLVRFGISGVALTVLALGLAWVFEHWLTPDPNIAFVFAFVIASTVGFVLHSQWSFKGHGGRDRPHIRLVQFFASNTIGFFLNQFFIWAVRKYFGLPFWMEIIPVLFVTPLATFTLNRKWVFN